MPIKQLNASSGVFTIGSHRAVGNVDGTCAYGTGASGAVDPSDYALRDAIVGTQIPTVEVHLSNIHKRENFRKTSIIKNVCIGQFYGEGKQSYINGIKHILEKKK